MALRARYFKKKEAHQHIDENDVDNLLYMEPLTRQDPLTTLIVIEKQDAIPVWELHHEKPRNWAQPRIIHLTNPGQFQTTSISPGEILLKNQIKNSLVIDAFGKLATNEESTCNRCKGLGFARKPNLIYSGGCRRLLKPLISHGACSCCVASGSPAQCTMNIARIPPQRPAPAQPAPETAHGALKLSRARASEPLLTASAFPPLRKNKPSKQRSARPNLDASSDQRATLQPPAQATPQRPPTFKTPQCDTGNPRVQGHNSAAAEQLKKNTKEHALSQQTQTRVLTHKSVDLNLATQNKRTATQAQSKGNGVSGNKSRRDEGRNKRPKTVSADDRQSRIEMAKAYDQPEEIEELLAGAGYEKSGDGPDISVPAVMPKPRWTARRGGGMLTGNRAAPKRNDTSVPATKRNVIGMARRGGLGRRI